MQLAQLATLAVSCAFVVAVRGAACPALTLPVGESIGFPPVLENMNKWAGRNGCPSPPATTWRNGTFSNSRWSGCGAHGDVTVEIVLSAAGRHEWPPPSADFDTTPYVLDWLESVSTPSAVTL